MKIKDKRYYSFSQFLRERFGCKVYKLPIDAGFTCPNRDGKIGYGGCTYCYNPSFSPPTLVSPLTLPLSPNGRGNIYAQIKYRKALIKRKKKVKFLAYFQPYTNTYAKKEVLKKLYDEALQDEDIIGLCIGTRPDCVPDEVLDLIESYARDYHIWIEYGLQSIHDKTLLRINRGHNFAQFEDAIKRTQNRGIFICVHIILGLPGETRKDMLQTAKVLAKMKVDGIKIHHLQVIKATSLAEDFKKGKFKVFSFEEYVPLICDVLELLPPNITIQRLVGEVLQDEILIAPRWNLGKHEVLSAIEQELIQRHSFQSLRVE
ncbi:TIGR01212 family radical SAM protein [Candidatus Aerophobetes bacterium]|nr:TIGR01212 family radical SAM protein [Candidatus Aerophobetes bacterium]